MRRKRMEAMVNNVRPETMPGRSRGKQFLSLAVSSLSIFAALNLAGCGSSGKSGPSSVTQIPVIVGTRQNSLPTPPTPTDTTNYAGVGVAGGNDNSWTWLISHPNQTYTYQLQQGASGTNGGSSAGIFTSVGDFQFLADNSAYPYTEGGLNVEIDGGVSLLEPAFTGFPTDALAVGVAQLQTGCLAPNGKVSINFVQLQAPGKTSKTIATDATFAHADLSYSGGVFHYSNIQQLAISGAPASTKTIPFSDSYCIQAAAGYGLQSTPIPVAGGSETSLAYLGGTGVLVGSSAGPADSAGLIGIVEPSAPIDLAAVTAGTYRGFYDQDEVNVYQDPAYFGATSKWVTSPALPQTSGTLVGGYEDFFTFQFAVPENPVTGTIRIDFGSQDASHPGLFPAATISEPYTGNTCPVSERITGPNGAAYCTFPVVAIIGQSYGKFEIFITGPEPTTGNPLFYALLQD